MINHIMLCLFTIIYYLYLSFFIYLFLLLLFLSMRSLCTVRFSLVWFQGRAAGLRRAGLSSFEASLSTRRGCENLVVWCQSSYLHLLLLRKQIVKRALRKAS